MSHMQRYHEHNMITAGIQGWTWEIFLTPGYILGNSRGKGWQEPNNRGPKKTEI